MAQYDTLKATIDAYIRANYAKAITGPVLNGILNAMVDSLGTGFQFMGEATPATDPGRPDQNVAYIAATAGTYEDFANLTLPSGKVGLFTWDGSWHLTVLDIPTEEAVPTKTSDIINDSGFITNAVADLANYYLKTETYTAAQVDQLVASLTHIEFVVAPSLPTASAATMNKIYLIPSAHPSSPDVKDEYVTILNGGTYSWELIGRTYVDLSNYPTIAEMNAAIDAALTTIISGVNVTVDANVGTPSATVTFSGGIMSFAFHNLKGETGAQGPQGIQGPQGETGPQGPAAKIADNLTTDDSTVALSAAQGVVLEGEISQLGQKVDDFAGMCAIGNGSNGNTGNAYFVHTEVISTKGARYAIIKVNRPNVPGYHYSFGWALTSSKTDIGKTDEGIDQWDGYVQKADISATTTDIVLDMVNYPNTVGVSFTIGEYDAQGNYRVLRETDFSEGDVIINCQPGIDNLITDKLHKELWGLDIISFEGVRGYINGSGVASTDNAYRTRYIDRSYFSGNQLIVGMCSFVHFYDVNKNWLSCFASWSGSAIIQISGSDIPANCAFVVVCCRTANTYLKLYNKDEYLATQRLTPFYPFLREGTARYYSTKNYLSTAIIFPAYGASSVRFTILKSAETGLHYEINANLYTTVSQLTTDTVPISKFVEWEATNIVEVNMAGYEGVAFSIRKMDGSGNLQTLDGTEFSKGEILMERIYVPELLLPVFNNDAFARNRDKEAMMAAAVRANKKSEGSMDFMNLIVTDSHDDALSESNSVVMANNFPFIQSLIHCGDFCGNDATSFNADRYNRLLVCKKPFYFVAGNHDVGNSNLVSKCITNAQYYTRYVQPIVDAGLLSTGEYTDGKGYYYHDFAEKKIRLVVLYEYDDPNDLDPNDSTKYRYKRGDSVISQAQAEWFCGVLNSTPANYGIIVAMHNPFSALADCVTTAKFNDPDWVDGYGSQRLFSTDLWADIVDAWVNKSPDYHCSMVCTGDASYLNVDGEYYSFDYDFSGRNNTAKFICFIGGHVHRDCVWRHRTYRYQYQITPVCSSSTYQQSPLSDIRRTNTDGLAKDSLTAIGYDYDNQAIRLVKLGVNVTENMVARNYELIKTQEP